MEKETLIKQRERLFSEKKLRHTIICGIPKECDNYNMEKISELSGEEDESNLLNRSEKFNTMAEIIPTAMNSNGKVSIMHFNNENEKDQENLLDDDMHFDRIKPTDRATN